MTMIKNAVLTYVPPIKSQGIKTKLIPLIRRLIPHDFRGRWVEPFMGTGCVGFNLAPCDALMCDTNPGVINFYQGIVESSVTSRIVRTFLEKEGELLARDGETHYYKVRERFNLQGDPLDFLFLNRACFNGMIRFNRRGEFNTPFCRKPERFAPAYVTKIVNQVERLTRIFSERRFEFRRLDFTETFKLVEQGDLVYCDPPYLGRHTDYYNSWSSDDEATLFQALRQTSARFILSTWSHNEFRVNSSLENYWSRFNLFEHEHFYHIGGKEENRRPMVEALAYNFELPDLEQGGTTQVSTAQSYIASSTPLFDFFTSQSTPNVCSR